MNGIERFKVILDVNIWISHFIMGRANALSDFIIDNELTVYSCPELLDELTNVIQRDKFDKYLKAPHENFLTLHQDLTQFVDIELVFADSPDPKDNYLFDLALQHEADYLITGDKKLLAMESVDDVRIIFLRTFEALMSDAT